MMIDGVFFFFNYMTCQGNINVLYGDELYKHKQPLVAI